MTIDYIHENAPGIPVILDVKRGDIGSTATQYAREAFDRYGADAVTVEAVVDARVLGMLAIYEEGYRKPKEDWED
jgi:orotidine-5'-phosphate decarboxylase